MTLTISLIVDLNFEDSANFFLTAILISSLFFVIANSSTFAHNLKKSINKVNE